MILEQILTHDLGCAAYLVGCDHVGEAIVVDPPLHVQPVLDACERHGLRLVGVIETHTHADHVAGHGVLAARHGTCVATHPLGRPEYATRAIADGDRIVLGHVSLEVLHTPGHAPNHLCFLLEEERLLFTGDTVLDGMFSVVSPQRGGDMNEYLASLGRMEKLRLSRLAPGHGDVIDDARPRIQEYVAHRHDRERQVLALLKKQGPAKIPDMVTTLYADRDLHPKLVEAAGWQLHAHLLKLKGEGKVVGTSVRSAWTLA